MTTDTTQPARFEHITTTPPADSGVARVEREGGRYNAGLIRGVAVLSSGEALGHGTWVDYEMLADARDEMARADKPKNGDNPGIKSRFTHPSLSGDGLGRFLGRVENPRLDLAHGVLRGDLHLSATAHDTPDGNLAEYVMDLAEEDPAAFGLSIVFERDLDAEDAFVAKHSTYDEETRRHRFQSPDGRNTENLPHARIKELRAADAVDDPAANPSGLFHRQEIAHEADALLSFVTGQTADVPQLQGSAFSAIHPARIQRFFAGYLDRHNLQLSEKITMPSEQTADNQPQPLTLDQLDAQYGKAPAEWKLEQLKSGATAEQAAAAWSAHLEAQLAAAQEKAEELSRKLEAVASSGQDDSQDAGEFTEGDKDKTTFASMIRIRGN